MTGIIMENYSYYLRNYSYNSLNLSYNFISCTVDGNRTDVISGLILCLFPNSSN